MVRYLTPIFPRTTLSSLRPDGAHIHPFMNQLACTNHIISIPSSCYHEAAPFPCAVCTPTPTVFSIVYGAVTQEALLAYTYGLTVYIAVEKSNTIVNNWVVPGAGLE